jgi:insertion element IS1 protein InsB
MQCPQCQREWVINNGSIHNGKPKWKCKHCGRPFVAKPKWRPVSDATKVLIDKLLCEKISLAGIARVVELSESWVQTYVNAKVATVPRTVDVQPKKRGV